MERRPLVIVGAGPAGTASALFLHAQAPALAREILLLDKAKHPRTKVCAGGLIPHTTDCLHELGVPLSVPHVVVHRARVDIPQRSVSYAGRDLCRVVRRDEFDYSLVRACRQRGIEVRDGEKVLALRRENGSIRVETERRSYEAALVIGADGSGSVVRRQLFPGSAGAIGRAIMCDVPVAGADWDGFANARYDFDFRAVPEGLRGYEWAFPCIIAGEPHVNLGVYSVEAAGSGQTLAALLQRHVRRLGSADVPVQAFPIRRYKRGGPLCGPNLLLVGDAAGVDPLMGEGISFAFEYGRHAAAAAAATLQGDPQALFAYQRNITSSWMDRKLRRLDLAVRLFYGPTWRLWFAVAAASRQAQEIGIRWYNGVDQVDRRPAGDLLRAFLRGEFKPAAQ
jgi:flavin-dependent dehydrogenase